MDKIRNKLSIEDNILPVPYWDITTSGKVLELRVKPSIDFHPGKYRLGIIQIGRIISRIQTLAEQSGSKPQIQLFPNLSENQLAATVFWPGFMEDEQGTKSEEIHRTPLSDSDMQTIAGHYDLKLSADEPLTSDDDTNSVFHVVSKSNQPFIWLKLGQFIQDLTEQVEASPSSCDLTIEILTTYTPERSSSTRKVSYKQAKIYIGRKNQFTD